MKTMLLTIAFTLGGIFTSLAQAQIVPLTIDSTQSSISFNFTGAVGTSPLSGDASVELELSGPPSGNAQITDLNLVADDGLNVSFASGFVSFVTSPGDVTLSLQAPGVPGTISGTSFDQLANAFAFTGDLDVVDGFGFVGGNQTVDLSTVSILPTDFNAIDVAQSGDEITLSNSFTFSVFQDFGTGPILIEVDVTFVATGTFPPSVLMGDVNLDGAVDCFDIYPFIRVLITREFQVEADTNQSGTVTFADIPQFIDALNSQ